MAPDPIPPELIEDIDAGRCVAFVGAGFTVPAQLPTWTQLVDGMAAAPGLDPEVVRHVRHVVVGRKPSAHELDQAAQLLEDSLGRERFIAELRRLMQANPDTPVMRRRLEWLRGIPFRAVVTTNFDGVIAGLVPSPASYRALLRPAGFRWWERAFWGDPGLGAPVLALHGDLSRHDAGETVVLTRRDYRRRLYGDPGYMTFLRGLLSTNTVLFMGFSFEDAYLNELRSQVLALFDESSPVAAAVEGPGAARPGEAAHGPTRPLAFAILHDVPELVKLHFERHEAIHVLGFDSADPPDFGGFDAYLEAIWERTALLPRFGRLLAGRRILWLDPHPNNNTDGYRFLERAAHAHRSGEGPAIHHAASVEEALAELRRAEAGRGFELTISHWGEGDARDEAGHPLSNAEHLLACMRREDLRCPVVVLSNPSNAEARKRRALALGARAYCFRWESLFRTLDDLLRPAAETG